MKEEIINLSKKLGIDKIGFCNLNELIVPYEKYKLQDALCYKGTFQTGDISDKDLSSDRYFLYNTGIVICVSYNSVDMSDIDKVYLSSCSVGLDYHVLLKNKLKVIGEYLEELGYLSNLFVDNNPLDERVLAYNAGLGFFGKNNLLINDELGSYFYIGVLLTDAIIESDKIINNKCISCNKCIKVCPTKALNDSGILDCNKCLSYLTQKKDVSSEYHKYFNNCIYGCDKCISVCPYNKNTKSNIVPFGNEEINPSEFLDMSIDEYKDKYKNNSCFWRGKNVLDRNIKIYYVNRNNK